VYVSVSAKIGLSPSVGNPNLGCPQEVHPEIETVQQVTAAPFPQTIRLENLRRADQQLAVSNKEVADLCGLLVTFSFL